MKSERFEPGWQEGAFARCRDEIASTPAFYRHIAPADAAEEAYLMAWASTIFLREESSPPKADGIAIPAKPPLVDREPIGVPPFAYERCLKPSPEAEEVYRACLAGEHGSFHLKVAKLAGSAQAWCSALRELKARGALKTGLEAGTPLHAPSPPSFQEDLSACWGALLRKVLHAFKIGFGLWGRWEAA